MSFEVKRTDLAGRIGKLQTDHGALETPFLFPVVDPTRQTPSLDEIKKMGFNGIITNAYLFYKRNRGKVHSIHAELRWNDVIMTDSGGYQILVYGDVEVDNKTIVEYEMNIRTDIAVILDIPTGSSMGYDDAEKAVYETYKRGLEALPLIAGNSRQLWVYPIQGAPYRELVVRSSILARKLPYDIYAIGSPTVMLEKYEYSKLVETVALARLHIPPNKPLHVFGVGHPMVLPFLVAVGADLFDSASYVLYARSGRYMVETGTKSLRELASFPCNCPICSKHTPQELMEMDERERVELLAKHNLYMLVKEIKTIKQHIKEGRFWELLIYRSRGHPALYGAFKVVKKYSVLLERFSPTTNPGGRAVLLYSVEDVYNPRIRVNVRKAEMIALKDLEDKTVIVIPAHRKPYNTQEEYVKIKATAGGADSSIRILLIHPLLGLIHPGLTSTYPFYQHKCRITRDMVEEKKILDDLKRIAKRKPRKIILVTSSWLSDEMASKIVDRVRKEIQLEIAKYKLDEISSLVLQ